MKKTILASLLILMANPLYSQDITGQWNGVLNVMGNQMTLVFHIQKTDSGYSATFDSPDQGAKDIPFTSAIFDEPELQLAATNIGAVYRGKLEADSIVGSWNQGGQSIPLNLYKETVEKTAYRRPQEPEKPYPYIEEEVSFRNEQDSVTLAGTLTLPDKNGLFPAVILISGSGPQNRDEEVFGHKPFLVLADHLTRHGIAVLRYDDRGTAESTGNFGASTTADFAADAMSAVNFLKTRSEIDADQIGLIGHSEGGIIAPLVVNQTDHIAFMVILAGTAIPGKELSLRQSLRLQELRPFEVQDEEAYRNVIETSLEIATSEKSLPEKRKELYKSLKPILETLVPEGVDPDTYITQQVDASLSPWMQYFYGYNPADELEKVTIPVLSLNGSNDMQVEASINQVAIIEALAKAGNKDYKVLELEGLNHMFQESETGSMNEYATIEQTFSPLALEEITGWIKQHLN